MFRVWLLSSLALLNPTVSNVNSCALEHRAEELMCSGDRHDDDHDDHDDVGDDAHMKALSFAE